MKQNKKEVLKNILLALIPLIIVIVVFASAVSIGMITIGDSNLENTISDIDENANEITVTVIFDFGDENTETVEVISTKTTVYGFLIEAAGLVGYDVKTTYYGQYNSIFVDSISTYENGQSDKYWVYYLNGESGTVGADQQIVTNGDIIEWKFEGL